MILKWQYRSWTSYLQYISVTNLRVYSTYTAHYIALQHYGRRRTSAINQLQQRLPSNVGKPSYGATMNRHLVQLKGTQTDKSMKYALYVLWYTKRIEPVGLKQHPTVKKPSPYIALALQSYDCLKASLSQPSQSAGQYKIIFSLNFVATF